MSDQLYEVQRAVEAFFTEALQRGYAELLVITLLNPKILVSYGS